MKRKAPKPPTAKQLKARNKAFWRMSAAKRQVAMAKEALAMLKAKTVTPSHMFGYVSGDEQPTTRNAQLAFIQNAGNVKCSACAGGCLMLAQARLGNRIRGDLGYSGIELEFDTYTRQLGFTPRDRLLIEAAYETGKGAFRLEDEDGYSNSDTNEELHISGLDECPRGFKNAATVEDVNKAITFGKRYDDDLARMRAIFKNIIRNKGTFKP